MMELSNRELQVLKLTAWDCLSAKEIGDKLNISPTTAQNHIKNIKDKLHLQKISELCRHYYINIYASIILLIALPSLLQPNDFIRRYRCRAQRTELTINKREV